MKHKHKKKNEMSADKMYISIYRKRCFLNENEK